MSNPESNKSRSGKPDDGLDGLDPRATLDPQREKLSRASDPMVKPEIHDDDIGQTRELSSEHEVHTMSPRSESDSDTGFLRPELTNRDDEFRMIRAIGRGGMGEIWEAEQKSLNRVVALKRLHVNSADREALFRKEALTTAQLDHPTIVPVHDLVADAHGRLMLAMKRVRGISWEVLLPKDRLLMDEGAFLSKHLQVLVAVAQAVAFAHSRGIIHRDLKPAQVVVGEFGETYLMDWGLAITFDEALVRSVSPDLEPVDLPTPVTAMNPAGTVAYMAPEQAQTTGNALGPWTDLYLLGGTLYEVLTGRTPRSEGRFHELLDLARNGKYTPLTEAAHGRELPGELVQLIELCLQPEFQKRALSAAGFVERLRDYLTGAGRARESEQLTKSVAVLLPDACADYRGCTDILAQLDRAHTLWSGNPEEPKLRARALELFARLAINHGDLTLARVQVAGLANGGIAKALTTEIDRAERAQRARERSRRVALAGVALLLVIVAIGSAVFMGRLRVENESTNKAWEITRDELSFSSLLLASSLLDQNRIDLAERTLWQVPPEKRNWEWGYQLSRASRALIDFDFTAVGDPLPGDIVVGYGQDRELRLYDLHTGEARSSLGRKRDEIVRTTVARLGDGLILSFGDGRVEEFNVSTGQLLGGCSLPEEAKTGLIVAGPEPGTIVVPSRPNGCRLVKISTGETIREFNHSYPPCEFTSTSDDGRRLAMGSAAGISVWDLSTGALLATQNEFGIGRLRFRSVHLSPKGKYVGYWVDYTRYAIMEVDTGLEFRGGVLESMMPSIEYREMAFSEDERHAAIIRNNDIAILSLPRMSEEATVRPDTGRFAGMAFSSDSGRLLTFTDTGVASVWDWRVGEEICRASVSPESVEVVNLSASGDLLVTSQDGKTTLWDANNGQPDAVVSERDSRLQQNDRFLVGLWDFGAVVRDLTSKIPPVQTFNLINAYRAIAINEEKATLVICGKILRDQGIRLITNDLHTGAVLIDELISLDESTRVLASQHAGHIFVVDASDERSISAWDTTTGKRTGRVANAYGPSVSMLPQGDLGIAVASPDGKIDTYLLPDMRHAGSITPRAGRIVELRTDRNSERMAAIYADGEVLFMDFDPLQVRGKLPSKVDTATASTVTIDDEGGRVVTSDMTNGVRLFDLATLNLLRQLPPPRSPAVVLGITPDDSRLIESDGFRVRVREFGSGREVALINKRVREISADQTTMVVRHGVDGSVLWKLAPYRLEDLPGSADMSWESRYDLWRAMRYRDWWMRSIESKAPPGFGPLAELGPKRIGEVRPLLISILRPMVTRSEEGVKHNTPAARELRHAMVSIGAMGDDAPPFTWLYAVEAGLIDLFDADGIMLERGTMAFTAEYVLGELPIGKMERAVLTDGAAPPSYLASMPQILAGCGATEMGHQLRRRYEFLALLVPNAESLLADIPMREPMPIVETRDVDRFRLDSAQIGSLVASGDLPEEIRTQRIEAAIALLDRYAPLPAQDAMIKVLHEKATPMVGDDVLVSDFFGPILHSVIRMRTGFDTIEEAREDMDQRLVRAFPGLAKHSAK